jgi:hypothetical protein
MAVFINNQRSRDTYKCRLIIFACRFKLSATPLLINVSTWSLKLDMLSAAVRLPFRSRIGTPHARQANDEVVLCNGVTRSRGLRRQFL